MNFLMTAAKVVLPAFFVTFSLFAQHQRQPGRVVLNHPLMASRHDARATPVERSSFPDTVRVLAVMVQFQPDNDIGTNGDGRFNLSTPAEPGLDAPPHDRRYFLDHLTFLANYYAKVSKGRLYIQATLVDSVFTLPHQMARYSPPKNGPNTAVGDLARDSWLMVDSSGLVPDFSVYDCFVVFHAGVGRDIDVVSVLGYDPTPRDIPSLYLGLDAFKQFYGQSYDGIPVRNGFRITNTIVMPETEERELPATPQNFVLRLGINGLLCASFGNFLGLPDLFDTNTGRSGIGRFGLMDGQAIFSFAGAFPPEPSAWEKYWLGWLDPIVLESGEHTVQLPAVTLADTVYRIPISGAEYYLMENRSRDARRDGARITTRYGGVVREQTFVRDTTGFNAFDLSALRGNVIDVDEFDFSLPGGVSSHGEFFDGGVLIWHIDEGVIAQGLRANGVNANPNRRGVDVEEADGSQDIGQRYGQFDPGSGSEEGTALDFWYAGNASPVYRNEFSATTNPGTMSNSGANSHVSIGEFTARAPRMSARVRVGDAISLLPGFPKQIRFQPSFPSITVAPVGPNDSLVVFIATTGGAPVRPSRDTVQTSALHGEVYAWKLDGMPLFGNGLFARTDLPGASFVGSPAVADIDGNGLEELIIAENRSDGGVLHIYRAGARPSDSLAQEVLARNVAKRPTTSPLVTDSVIAFGAQRATVYLLFTNGFRLDSLTIAGDSSEVVGLAAVNSSTGIVFTTAAGRLATNTAQTFYAQQPSGSSSTSVGTPVVGRINQRYPLVAVTVTASGRVQVYDLQAGLAPLPGFPVEIGENIISPPALADIDGDGNRDIVVFGARKIVAVNYAGAALDNFPKLVPGNEELASHPIVADVDGDRDVDIVAVTRGGLVLAYDRNARMASGFPLQAGRGWQSVAAFTSPVVGSQLDWLGLVVASSDDGSLGAWRTGTEGPTVTPLRGSEWPQFQADARHSGRVTDQLAGAPVSTSFFPKDRAYNWPNPAYGDKTFIRYFVSENATVKIKIFDVAGDVVTEINGPGVGGVDNEVAWDVSGVQSGVYLARIEASSGGKSEVAIVKVAVVK